MKVIKMEIFLKAKILKFKYCKGQFWGLYSFLGFIYDLPQATTLLSHLNFLKQNTLYSMGGVNL